MFEIGGGVVRKNQRSLWSFLLMILASSLIVLAASCAAPTDGGSNNNDLNLGNTWWKRVKYDADYDERFHSVTGTNDGNYVAVGSADYEVFVYKFSEAGEKTWEQRIEYDSAQSCAYHVFPTSNDGDGFIALGYVQIEGRKNAYALKILQDGTVGWKERYESGDHNWILEWGCETEGGYLFMGYALDNFGASRLLVIVADSDGKATEDSIYIYKRTDIVNQIFHSGVAHDDNTFLFAGYDENEGKLLLIKFDPTVAGDKFEQIFEYSDSRLKPYSMIVLNDDSLVIAGQNMDESAGFIMKLAESTDSSWQKSWLYTYNNADNEDESAFYSICESDDGGLVAVGCYYDDYTSNTGALAVKVDDSGNLELKRSLVYSDLDELHSVIQTNDGGFILVGSTTDSDLEEEEQHRNDGIVIRTNKDCMVDSENEIED